MSIAQIVTTAAASVGIELKLSKTSEAKLDDAGTMEYATDDMKLLTQNEIADSLCILTDGVHVFVISGLIRPATICWISRLMPAAAISAFR